MANYIFLLMTLKPRVNLLGRHGTITNLQPFIDPNMYQLPKVEFDTLDFRWKHILSSIIPSLFS